MINSTNHVHPSIPISLVSMIQYEKLKCRKVQIFKVLFLQRIVNFINFQETLFCSWKIFQCLTGESFLFLKKLNVDISMTATNLNAF